MLQTKRNFLSVFIILSISYMFLVTVGGAYGLNIDYFSISENRAPILMVIVVFGLVNILFRGTIFYNNIILSGLIFAIYMFIVGLVTYSRYYDIGFFISCSVFWILIIFILYNIELTTEQLVIRANILTAFLCLISLIYIVGNILKNVEESILSINSIYYIVTAIPFLFICKNKVLQIIAFLLSSGAILISGKSTVLIIWVCICVLFYRNIALDTRLGAHKTVFTFVLLVMAIPFAWNFIQPYLSVNNFGELFANVFNELQDGGNGRFEIYGIVIDVFKELPLPSQIFGKGFYAIDNTINSGTHNDFLMILYNYGIIGFCLYISFYIKLIKNIKVMKKENDQFVTAYIASVIIFFALSLASNVINSQIQLLLICVFWGLFYPRRKLTDATQGVLV